MSWKRVSGAEAVEPGAMKQLPTEDGQEILVLNHGGTYFACQASCPHLRTPLEEGIFDGETLTCHQHFWQWDIASGDPKGLAEEALQCYRIRADDRGIYIWRDD